MLFQAYAPSGWSEAFVWIAMIVVLVFRPEGLFGTQEPAADGLMGTVLSEPVLALVAINVLLTPQPPVSVRRPGVWSLGMSGFMAVGAYTAAYLTTELEWPVGHRDRGGCACRDGEHPAGGPSRDAHHAASTCRSPRWPRPS